MARGKRPIPPSFEGSGRDIDRPDVKEGSAKDRRLDRAQSAPRTGYNRGGTVRGGVHQGGKGGQGSFRR